MMRRYRRQESELQAMQWTAETHDQVDRWLRMHGFGYHIHDEAGEIWPDEDYTGTLGSMCIDTDDDLEIELGMWLTWDPATNELSYKLPGFDETWELVQ